MITGDYYSENELNDGNYSSSSVSSSDEDDDSSSSSSYSSNGETDSSNDSSYESNGDANIAIKEINVLTSPVFPEVDTYKEKSQYLQVHPVEIAPEATTGKEERSDVVDKYAAVQQAENRVLSDEEGLGAMQAEKIKNGDVIQDREDDYSYGKNSDHYESIEEKEDSSLNTFSVASVEESIILKISSDEKVTIQLSNEETGENDEYEKGIEFEVLETSSYDAQTHHETEESQGVRRSVEEIKYTLKVENQEYEKHQEKEKRTQHNGEQILENTEANLQVTSGDIENENENDSEDDQSNEDDTSDSDDEVYSEDDQSDEDDDDSEARNENTDSRANREGEAKTLSKPDNFVLEIGNGDRKQAVMANNDGSERNNETKGSESTTTNAEISQPICKVNISSSQEVAKLEPAKRPFYELVDNNQRDPVISYYEGDDSFHPLTEKTRKDGGIRLGVEVKSERVDALLEDFAGLRRRVVKPRSAWWIKNEDEHREEKSLIVIDESTKKFNDFMMKQLEESEAVDSIKDFDLIGTMLHEERSLKKDIKPKKIWWHVGVKPQVSSSSVPTESRKWFFDSLHDKEKLQGCSASSKNLLETKLLKKQGWLTEKDRTDEQKIKAHLMQQDQGKLSTNESVSNQDESEQEHHGPEEKRKEKAIDLEEGDSADEEDKSDELAKSTFTSVDMAIVELQKEIRKRIVENSIVHEAKEEEPVSFIHPLAFAAETQKARSAKEILKRNSKKCKRLAIQLETPTPQIKDLIDGAKGDSFARRMNSCGTMKLLASKKSNISMLIHSDGLLKAIIFVVGQPVSKEEKIANENAKLRALVTLSMLAQPKDGRRIICQQDGLMKCLLNVLTKDKGELCLHACNVITALAKTEENREIIITRKGLLRKLSSILRNAEEKGDDSIDLAEKDEKAEDEGSVSRDESEDATTSSLKKQINAIRMNACAALLHLSKHCGATAKMCEDHNIIENIAVVCQESSNPVHTKCIEIMSNLTRFTGNIAALSRNVQVFDALYSCGISKIHEDRLWTMRSIQNMAADSLCKIRLASDPMIELIRCSAENFAHVDENEAAVAAIANLCTDAASVLQVTNSKKVLPTLIKVAHGSEFSPEVHFHACTAISRISVWLQTFARATTVLDASEPLPTMTAKGNLRWGCSMG